MNLDVWDSFSDRPMKILLVGILPPPIGGVSVYLKRYRDVLFSKGHCVTVFDPRGKRQLEKLGGLYRVVREQRFDEIQLHLFDLGLLAILLVARSFGRLNLVLHNSHNLDGLAAWKLISYRLLIPLCKKVSFSGHELPQYYSSMLWKMPARTEVIDVFIPPLESEEDGIWESYPAEAVQFINQARPLVATGAFKLITKEGVDLYGIDMCIELIRFLKPEFPSVGLFIGLASVGDEGYLNELETTIREVGISDNVFFLSGQRQLWPVFRQSALMVRPSFQDAFGISCAEALHFGCPALASDVCSRPRGTVLFRSRDQRDFNERALSLLRGSISGCIAGGFE